MMERNLFLLLNKFSFSLPKKFNFFLFVVDSLTRHTMTNSCQISAAAEAAALGKKQDKSALLEYSGKFSEQDLRHFRQVAFIAVALSTVTMLACVIVMPIAYQYIQRVQSSITSDIEFCRSRNRDLWSEVLSVQQGKGQHTHAERLKRDTAASRNGRWLFGHFVQNHDVSAYVFKKFIEFYT